VIFDCHTHWADCFKQRDGLTPAGWLKTLDRYDVTHAVVLPFTGLMHAGKIPLDNDDIAAVCAMSGGRMIPFCTVNPWFREEAVAELRRCFETLKFRGIKFHPWLQGVSPSIAAMDEICEIAAEHRAPILFHDGTPAFSLPSQIALLARRHPRTNIILGHCGLLDHWREAIASLNVAENLWGCLCGPHPAALREIIAKCDTSRLLWGSDYGFGFTDMIGYRLELFDHIDLNDSTRRAILTENPQRLFA
jgi:predicted TIM-barrel fold metal-dependent hydrolase